MGHCKQQYYYEKRNGVTTFNIKTTNKSCKQKENHEYIRDENRHKLARTQQQRMQPKYANDNKTLRILEKAKTRIFYFQNVRQPIYVNLQKSNIKQTTGIKNSVSLM